MSIERVDSAPTIAQLIDRQREQIARALPAHMDADRLARIATTVIKSTPRLMDCSATSLLGALMLSAQTGLEPGPLGQVYFVPRRNKGQWECQWQLGYRGILELARRSGQLRSIEAREVCEHDEFSFRYGLDEQLEHQPAIGQDRGRIVAFWGLARFNDGGHYFLVMSKDEVDAYRARSSAGESGPWVSDYAAMGRKTVIRRMEPFLPLMSEQRAAIARDGGVTRVDAGGITADVAVDAAPAEFIDVETTDERRVTASEITQSVGGGDSILEEGVTSATGTGSGEAADREAAAGDGDVVGSSSPEPTTTEPEEPAEPVEGITPETAAACRDRIKAVRDAGLWGDVSKLPKAEGIPLNVTRMSEQQGLRFLELVVEPGEGDA